MPVFCSGVRTRSLAGADPALSAQLLAFAFCILFSDPRAALIIKRNAWQGSISRLASWSSLDMPKGKRPTVWEPPLNSLLGAIMTLNEFKAWLEGYEASFADGVPNAEQYGKINDKLKTVSMIQPATPQPIARGGVILPSVGPYVGQPQLKPMTANDYWAMYPVSTCGTLAQ